MAEHAVNKSALREAVYWAIAHRRKIIAAVVVALPFAARLIPGFPADVIGDALKAYLGS